jgi:hypothetical protein
VDKVTKAKIPMVTGGYNGGYMSSTELLINGHWQSGTIQCPKIAAENFSRKKLAGVRSLE